MRDDLDPVIREEVPADLKAKVAAKVGPALARNKERHEASPGVLAWLFHPAALGGAVAAGLVAAFVITRSAPAPQGELLAGPMQYDLEMLTNAELLDDLDVLEEWETLKKAESEWKKNKG